MSLLRRCGWFAGLGAATFVAAVLALTGIAHAAFPGRNGLLAVQPLNGSGVVLVKANGGGLRRVLCPALAGPTETGFCRPAWARDGRTLVISATYPSTTPPAGHSAFSAFDVVYPDGSCLDCGTNGTNNFYGLATAGKAAPTSDPTLFTAVVSPVFPGGSLYGPSAAGLAEFSIDGLLRTSKPLVSGPVSDPAWSSSGELAIVRRGWIWVGRPGKLRRLTPGGSPSWSPGGKQIVFQRRGRVLIIRVRGGSIRRLVQGTAPAWSPDGGWIAFFGKSHRLNVVPAVGGRARHVVGVTGSAVDWQPLSAKSPAPCLSPTGSRVIANSDTGVVSVDSGVAAAHELIDFWAPAQAVMGCLRADGRERVLVQRHGLGLNPSNVAEAAIAGNYAAVASHSVGYDRYTQTSHPGDGVELFDLRTGAAVPNRGGEQDGCSYGYPGPPCETSMDQLVLGSDAVSAVHTTVRDNGCTCTVEQIQASDGTGVHTLDSVTEPDGSPPALTNLTLTGDALTWEHNGQMRSAQLQP